jgi:hypothetical protein
MFYLTTHEIRTKQILVINRILKQSSENLVKATSIEEQLIEETKLCSLGTRLVNK